MKENNLNKIWNNISDERKKKIVEKSKKLEIHCRNKETGVEFILTEEQYEELKHMFDIIEEKK